MKKAYQVRVNDSWIAGSARVVREVYGVAGESTVIVKVIGLKSDGREVGVWEGPVVGESVDVDGLVERLRTVAAERIARRLNSTDIWKWDLAIAEEMLREEGWYD